MRGSEGASSLGLELELQELQAKPEAGEEVTGVASPIREGAFPDRAEDDGSPPSYRPFADPEREVEEVLREASRSPKIGLILLASKLERAARRLAGYSDESPRATKQPAFRHLIKELEGQELIPAQTEKALEPFYSIRNKLVQGGDADNREITRAIDSGLTLLRILATRLSEG